MPEPLLFDDELLIRYLDGELNQDEQRMVEQQLQQDPSLQQRLQDLQLSIEAVKAYGTTQRVQSVHRQMMQELRSTPSSTPVRKILRYTMAAAASILLLVVGIRYYNSMRPDAGQLYDDAYVAFDVSGTRSSGTATDMEKAYGNHDYTRAIQLPTINEKDSLLKGISHLQLQQYPEAITRLERSVNQGVKYRQDAEFYLSLAYLRKGDAAKAYELMQLIHTNENHIYREQFSSSFLRKVERLKDQSR